MQEAGRNSHQDGVRQRPFWRSEPKIGGASFLGFACPVRGRLVKPGPNGLHKSSGEPKSISQQPRGTKGPAQRRGNAAAIGAKEMQRRPRTEQPNGKFYFYDSAEDSTRTQALLWAACLFVVVWCIPAGVRSLGCVRGIYIHVNQVESSSFAPPTARATRIKFGCAALPWLGILSAGKKVARNLSVIQEQVFLIAGAQEVPMFTITHNLTGMWNGAISRRIFLLLFWSSLRRTVFSTSFHTQSL